MQWKSDCELVLFVLDQTDEKSFETTSSELCKVLHQLKMYPKPSYRSFYTNYLIRSISKFKESHDKSKSKENIYQYCKSVVNLEFQPVDKTASLRRMSRLWS